MTDGDDKRALERYVAGLDVDADTLATAMTARAIDRTLVVEALLGALASPQVAVRRRAAQRIARMDELAPRIAAELRLVAATDADERVREACDAALLTHGEGVREEADATSQPVPAWRALGERLLASLWLKPLIMRSGNAVLLLVARERADAPATRAYLTAGDDGVLTLALTGLPADFTGTRPAVLVRREPDAPYETIGAAEQPVSMDGVANIRIAPEIGSSADVRRWLSRDIELVATED